MPAYRHRIGTCRHCVHRRRIYARGLCQQCHRDPDVRRQYAPLKPYSAPNDDGQRRCEAAHISMGTSHIQRRNDPEVVAGLLGAPWYAQAQYSPTVVRHNGERETRRGT